MDDAETRPGGKPNGRTGPADNTGEADGADGAARADGADGKTQLTDANATGTKSEAQRPRRERRGHKTVLIDLVDEAQLFHTDDGTGYADIEIDGHRETWPLRSNGFKNWLTERFFRETGDAPRKEALEAAIRVTQAKAQFDAPLREVHLRVGRMYDRLYLDLADPGWRAVEMDERGWRVVAVPPVRFRRAAGMKPLPVPKPGGTIARLRPFLNVPNDQDFILAVSWLLAGLQGRGPYPVLVVFGEQGAAKSTFSSFLRTLIDPSSAPLRSLPRKDHDLFLGAHNTHVLAFDNISALPGFVSDALCRLATGGSFATRQLYTDQDEVFFDAARPILLNGIEEFVSRGDLADRTILLSLTPIPESQRKREAQLRAAFAREHPFILGALLDAVVTGLRRRDQVHLASLPRMADFAHWVTACETALWEEGTFLKAYGVNRSDAVDFVLEKDPVAGAVRGLMTGRAEWIGTPTELFGVLLQSIDERQRDARSWPANASKLSGRLKRAAAALRTIGIDIAFERTGKSRRRQIRLTNGKAG